MCKLYFWGIDRGVWWYWNKTLCIMEGVVGSRFVSFIGGIYICRMMRFDSLCFRCHHAHCTPYSRPPSYRNHNSIMHHLHMTTSPLVHHDTTQTPWAAPRTGRRSLLPRRRGIGSCFGPFSSAKTRTEKMGTKATATRATQTQQTTRRIMTDGWSWGEDGAPGSVVGWPPERVPLFLHPGERHR